MTTLFTKLCNFPCILKTFSKNKPIINATNSYLNNARQYHINNIFVRSHAWKPILVNQQSFVNDKPKLVKLASSTAISSLAEKVSVLKKRPIRKKRILDAEDQKPPGLYEVVAFATADEYKLEELMRGLEQQNLYEPKNIDNNCDVVHAVAKYQVGNEPRELFFFREGTIIMWNITDLESSNVLNFLKPYELDSYSERLLQSEAEYMNYKYLEQGKSFLSKNGDIVITPNDNILEKYTFSNAMALSVKLGIWEQSLEKYIETIESVTEDLKRGNKIRMSQEDVLRKHGELFALRHEINLSSDLLDTPDFYWERDQLEVLYSQICSYFTIARRTRVMNEKINHCVELIELLSEHLSDKHHVRLEWMIICLIMVEVCFETMHYLERLID